ncbi:CBS domain-containing protein, partial [bacterium]|nr:CBS domain-containing protein [bacterium]
KMSIKSILQKKGDVVFQIQPDKPLCDCIKLLNVKRVGALMVIDKDNNIHGIISERDILHAAFDVKGQMCDMLVSDIMTPNDKLITATMEDKIEAIMESMTNNKIRHIPIMNNEKLLGIVSIGDIVKTLLDVAVTENKHMKNYISGGY